VGKKKWRENVSRREDEGGGMRVRGVCMFVFLDSESEKWESRFHEINDKIH